LKTLLTEWGGYVEDLYRLSQTQIAVFNRPYKRYFLREHNLTHRLCIILGQRGVGKTTAMVQHLLNVAGQDKLNPAILYIQADHFLLQNLSLYEIAEQFVNLGGRTICFDEIHKYPQWSLELKSITDTFTELNVLASGSSALEIYKGSHDLSRRAMQMRMWGMSFREYIEISLGTELAVYALEELMCDHVRIAHEIVDQLQDKKVLALFKEYLKHGYYPFYFEDRNEALFYQLLNQNLHTTVESDLIAVQPALTGNSIKKIAKLLRIISASVPFSPDLKKMTELTDVGDQRTLKTYLKYLEDCGLIIGLSRTGKGLRGMEKPEKIFLNNTNLIYAFAPDVNIGTIRETFFLNTLSAGHSVKAPLKGDFLIDDTFLFEVGGKNKDFSQIKEIKNSFLAVDDMEKGFGCKIPLWLFGFLY
jgi:predicted AAA+ superfamily ATPase